jgi:hypothetical protein
MKYIITENRLEKVILKYLMDKDFVEDVKITPSGLHIQVTPKTSVKLLFDMFIARDIRKMFNFDKSIVFHRLNNQGKNEIVAVS